jgi:hypothetical protein
LSKDDPFANKLSFKEKKADGCTIFNADLIVTKRKEFIENFLLRITSAIQSRGKRLWASALRPQSARLHRQHGMLQQRESMKRIPEVRN